jgi:hypothetical protein
LLEFRKHSPASFLSSLWNYGDSALIIPVRLSVPSLSRRLVRRDLLDLRRERVFGRFEIEARLNVHPERSARVEEFAEPRRGVGRNGLLFARDALDPGMRLRAVASLAPDARSDIRL